MNISLLAFLYIKTVFNFQIPAIYFKLQYKTHNECNLK